MELWNISPTGYYCPSQASALNRVAPNTKHGTVVRWDFMATIKTAPNMIATVL